MKDRINKKALVVTYYAGANYGAFWQAYGVGQYIKKYGYEVEYLRDLQMEEALLGGINQYEKAKNTKLLSAINEDFSITDKKGDFDLVVLGSDEIWNLESAKNPKRKQYWGQGIRAKKKISYAPCAINTSWKRLFLKIKPLYDLDGISVRDVPSKITLKRIIRKDIQVVIDPTFLISYDFIKESIIKEKYVLVYSYGLDSGQQTFVKKYAENNKLKIVVAGHEAAWADYNLACSPKEWLALFKYASYVFTTTFHGSVYSIIFEKEFALLGHNLKAVELLKSFGISVDQRGCTVKSADYTIIEKNKTMLLEKSVDYLNKNCDFKSAI